MLSLEQAESDDALARKAGQGDRAALERLLERHASSAITLAFAIVGKHQDALDVAQAALAQLQASPQPRPRNIAPATGTTRRGLGQRFSAV